MFTYYFGSTGDISQGTAEELCNQAYHGYITDKTYLEFIRDRVREELDLKKRDLDHGDCSAKQEDEPKLSALIEEIEEKEKYPEAPYNVGRMKFDILSGSPFFEEVRWYKDDEKTLTFTPVLDRDDILFSIDEVNTEKTGNCALSIPVKEFMGIKHATLEGALYACYYYNMTYEELDDRFEEHDDK